ncbi:hypothetical protein BDV98DRAFT_566980 [Pterulicium gracile]|uniref:F-box domain-containing protein n=1 Tax=Pterulicium gracile TaxID=1884261 RepID=A0A5C3QJS0_9AGAR|nr:hypothetical protein BDV98DRAFT_566980 [Pterula gracilis]
MIFEEASGWSDSDPVDDDDKEPPVEPPWSLAAVCTRWRRVALSSTCSHLWSYVNLNYDTSSLLPHLPHLDQRIQTQNSRASSSRVHLTVQLPHATSDEKPYDSRVRLAIRKAVTYILPKCSTASLLGSNKLWSVITEQPLELSLITGLLLRGESWLEADGLFHRVTLPNLKRLDLQANDIDVEDPVPQKWCPNLTSLSLCSVVTSLETVLSIFRTATTLGKVIIEDVQWAEDSNPVPYHANVSAPVKLRHRSELDLSFARDWYKLASDFQRCAE